MSQSGPSHPYASNATSGDGTNTASESRHDGVSIVPEAPYPPMMMMMSSQYHRNLSSSTQGAAQIKSSLSSKPQYTSTSSSMSGGGLSESATADAKANSKLMAHCVARFCHPSLVATINPVSFSSSSSSSSSATTTAGTDRTMTRKLGPVLLEIQRLQYRSGVSSSTILDPSWNTDANAGDATHTGQATSPTFAIPSLFALTSVAKSRGNPSLGTSVASTCLDVQFNNKATLLTDSISNNHEIQPCVTGLTTGALCLHTFSTTDIDWDTVSPSAPGTTVDSKNWFASTTEYYHTGRHHRPATAVAWRPNTQQVAIAWADPSQYPATSTNTSNHLHHSKRGPGGIGGGGIGSSGGIGGGGGMSGGVNLGGGGTGSGGGRSSHPHDRDFGCFVWDLAAHNTKIPIRRLGHQLGAAGAAWIMQGDLLVLGSMLRNFQVFDMRSEAPVSQPVTVVYAHPMSIHIRPDPFRPHQFATFARVGGNHGLGTGSSTISSSINNNTSTTEPVKLWDARRIDQAVCEIKTPSFPVWDVQWSPLIDGSLTVAVGDALYDYDTLSSRPVQTGMVSTEKTVTNFCLYPYRQSTDTQDITAASATTAKLPAVAKTVTTNQIAHLYTNRAIACFPDRTVQDVPKHRLAPVALSHRDGRLVHALGSQLWIGQTDQGPAAMECLLIRPEEDVSATMMRRARCLHAARYSMDTEANIKLLAEDGLVAHSDREVSPTRESLLRLWTWVERMEALFADNEDNGVTTQKTLVQAGASHLLRSIAGDETVHFSETLSCSIYTSPSRRAALTSCGWAGKYDLENVVAECEALGEFERSAALAVWHGDLAAGVQALQRGAASLRSAKESYAATLELVALCVAGFRGGSDRSIGIWRQACANLMERSDLSGVNRSVSRVAYMRGLLKFLMNTTDAGHQQVLDDDNLSLCDRVGFACRFLPRDTLQVFLDTCIAKCHREGNIEGLSITGIDRTGIQILQAYVDRYADVQTAALVTSRVILPTEWEQEKWICVEWLDAYRSLLNTWQMWQSRAMFDVDRSELMRKLQGREASQVKGPNARLQAVNRRFLMAVPFQMDARCTYCQQSLSLKQNNTNTNQWLREMNKSVLSCCPHCRSPLPRCAICMLSLGALNPFLELQAQAKRSGRQSPDDLTTTSNLPFAEWFSWCMRCKHGGHAHHMVGWFANHDVCPVSGCNCNCQFDGISKLNRPALTKSNASVPEV